MESRQDKKVILLLSASPKDAGRLRIEEEEREIKEQLRLAGYGHLPIHSSGASRPRDIQQALLDFRPHVVHFSGHGAKEGLALENDGGTGQLVEPEALGRLFELFARRSPIECVVLNSCYSQSQARSIIQHVDYVVGMTEVIKEAAALEFSVGFYKAIGAGESYAFAYQLGRIAIELAGLAGASVPALFVRKQDALVRKAPEASSFEGGVMKSMASAKLETLMTNGWWKEADIETTNIMLLSVGRQAGEWLRDEELERLPCDQLMELDQLWQRYSGGRFGFGVQRTIWEDLEALGRHPKADGDLERAFGDRAGWRENETWLSYHDYCFDISAPAGHLPRDFCRHSLGWWLGRSCLVATRLAVCQEVLRKMRSAGGRRGQ
jgi:hypothetical protein